MVFDARICLFRSWSLGLANSTSSYLIGLKGSLTCDERFHLPTVKPNTLWTNFHANISITSHHCVMKPHILAGIVEIDI